MTKRRKRKSNAKKIFIKVKKDKAGMRKIDTRFFILSLYIDKFLWIKIHGFDEIRQNSPKKQIFFNFSKKFFKKVLTNYPTYCRMVLLNFFGGF